MAAIVPTSGNIAVAKVGGTATNNIVAGINWKLNIDPKLKDNSNFRDGRLKNSTLFDASVTLRLIWDSSAPPTLAAGFNIRPGNTGTVYCYTDATNYFIVPGVWGPIGPENPGLEDSVGMDVVLEFSNGSITYPANG